MRMAAATAGLLSTAALLSWGCDRRPEPKRAADPVRRATYRSLVARDFLGGCGEASRRWETGREDRHFDQLKTFAAEKRAGYSVWLAENDWNAVVRFADRKPCGAGDQAYNEALADFEGALDQLATAIAQRRK